MTAAPDERVERAAVALVDALGQDWPIEQPTWKPETVEHWRGYKASWREAASMVLAAADDPAVAPNLCGVCGSNMKRAVGGQCVQAMYHPTEDQSS